LIGTLEKLHREPLPTGRLHIGCIIVLRMSMQREDPPKSYALPRIFIPPPGYLRRRRRWWGAYAKAGRLLRGLLLLIPLGLLLYILAR
jgi:hypothetical protein